MKKKVDVLLEIRLEKVGYGGKIIGKVYMIWEIFFLKNQTLKNIEIDLK